jgi:hypothetical protein
MAMALVVLSLVGVVAAGRSPLLPFGVVDTHVHMATPTNGIKYGWAKDPSTLSPPEK